MNKTKKVISIIFSLIAIGCLFSAIVLFIHHRIKDRQYEEALEAARVEAENIETENSLSDAIADQDISLPDENIDIDEDIPEIQAVPNPYAESFLAI